MTTIKQIMSLVDAYGDERCSGNEYNNRSAEKQARDAVLKALQGYARPRQPLTEQRIEQIWFDNLDGIISFEECVTVIREAEEAHGIGDKE